MKTDPTVVYVGIIYGRYHIYCSPYQADNIFLIGHKQDANKFFVANNN